MSFSTFPTASQPSCLSQEAMSPCKIWKEQRDCWRMSIFKNKKTISKWHLFACSVVKSVLWVKFSWKNLVKYTQSYNHNHICPLPLPFNTHQVTWFICLQMFKCQPGHQWCRHWSESLSKKRSFLQSPRGGHCPIGPGEICSKTDVCTWKVLGLLEKLPIGSELKILYYLTQIFGGQVEI